MKITQIETVKERKDVTIRTSVTRSEGWLMSNKRYTYPPSEMKEEFMNSNERRKAGSEAVYYD